MKKAWLWVIGIVLVVFLYGLSAYNGLVTARENTDTQWAQVENQFQRRFDLIPNLVETVKGIQQQEQKVFGDLAEARSQYAGAKTVDEKAAAAGGVESALARLLVIVENYPQLKSSENFLSLQAQLEGTENRVAVERGRFNDQVRGYNLKIKRFPSSLFARLFGFSDKTYFEAAEGTETPPGVKF